MSYPNTKVLNLGVPDRASLPQNSYVDNVANDQNLSGTLVKLDQFAAHVTASFCSKFAPTTGSVLNLNIGAGPGAGVLGIEFNRECDRVIEEIVGFTAASGSNPVAVVQVDVQVQQGATQPANFSSIFSNNAYKLAVSGSHANAPVHAKTFVSGTNMVWPKGTLLKVVGDLAASEADPDGLVGLNVLVYWKPSGSYGA